MSAVVGDEDSSCLEDSCADVLSLDEDPAIEMLEDDEDVDKPYLPLPPVPFVVTFVPALPLLPLLVPVLLYADDETDLQTFVRCEYREHQFHSAGPAAKGYPLPSLNPPTTLRRPPTLFSGYAMIASIHATRLHYKHTHAQNSCNQLRMSKQRHLEVLVTCIAV